MKTESKAETVRYQPRGSGTRGAAGGGVSNAPQAPANPEDTLVPDSGRVGNPPTSIRELRQNKQIWGFEKERQLTIKG